MIEINLLPQEMKKKKRRPARAIDLTSIDLEKIPVIKIALAAAGVFIAVQIVIFCFGMLGGIIFGSLEKSYKKILPRKQNAEHLKLQVAKMGKKVSAIDELMVRRFSWAKKLNELSDSLTPGIWLTQLEYDEKLTERPKASAANAPKNRTGAEKTATEKVLERYLIISGAASSMGEEGTALIGRFIKNLKENPSFYSDFNDIELGNIKRERVGDQEIMIFKITCLFKIK